MLNRISFSQAINDAMVAALKKNRNILCYGLGVSDPKEIFNTTSNLEKIFGNERVFDVPCSENALTGIAIGSAMNGCPVILSHQRSDFSLLSLDQIINNAAKWHYMFNGKFSVPITLRLIIGRGWGQGPTHSQTFENIYSSIPGLKVVMPYSPQEAKDLLFESIFDPNPVIFLEHRWLHDTIGYVKKKIIRKKIGKPSIIKNGRDLTIVCNSIMVIEALRAHDILIENGISAEIINLNTLKPLNTGVIEKSVKKTKRIVIIENSNSHLSIGSEILSRLFLNQKIKLKYQPVKISLKDYPMPTSYHMTKGIYPDFTKIINVCRKIFKKKIYLKNQKKYTHDIPNKDFQGPF